jgi:hypothetical protein
MTKAEQVKMTKAWKLRARAAWMCVRSNQLRVRADKLFDRAKTLLAKVDELYTEANALHGNVVRRQCLKCGRSFGSRGFGNRLCGDCNAQNATLLDPPSSPPKWNGQPMCN